MSVDDEIFRHAHSHCWLHGGPLDGTFVTLGVSPGVAPAAIELRVGGALYRYERGPDRPPALPGRLDFYLAGATAAPEAPASPQASARSPGSQTALLIVAAVCGATALWLALK